MQIEMANKWQNFHFYEWLNISVDKTYFSVCVHVYVSFCNVVRYCWAPGSIKWLENTFLLVVSTDAMPLINCLGLLFQKQAKKCYCDGEACIYPGQQLLFKYNLKMTLFPYQDSISRCRDLYIQNK